MYWERCYDEGAAEWRDAKAALESMVELCRSRNVRLVVFLFNDPAAPASQLCHDRYGRVLAAAGVPNYTFPAEAFGAAYRNSIVDSHPNAAGHERIAEEMLATIQPLAAEKRAAARR